MCEDPLVGSYTSLQIRLSKRGEEWVRFAARVRDHVENYTVPQYGDIGEDLVTEMTAEECAPHIQKYAKRQGKNSRGREQDKLDMLKIAHWA